MVVVNRDNKATYPIHIMLNSPYTNKYNNPIHQEIQRLQLKGLGINTLAFSHFDNILSTSSMKPERSIINTIILVNINSFNHIIYISIYNHPHFYIWVYYYNTYLCYYDLNRFLFQLQKHYSIL